MSKFTVYNNGGRMKSICCEGYGSQHLNYKECFDEIRRDDSDTVFTGKKDNVDVTSEFLIKLLHRMEQYIPSFQHDTKLMNRIIRGGGLIKYVNKLEGRK